MSKAGQEGSSKEASGRADLDPSVERVVQALVDGRSRPALLLAQHHRLHPQNRRRMPLQTQGNGRVARCSGCAPALPTVCTLSRVLAVLCVSQSTLLCVLRQGTSRRPAGPPALECAHVHLLLSTCADGATIGGLGAQNHRACLPGRAADPVGLRGRVVRQPCAVPRSPQINTRAS